MRSLNTKDKRVLEKFLEMGSGYVLDFTDQDFGEFVADAIDVEIHSNRYTARGSSKAKKLRAFWDIEENYLVGRLLTALIDYVTEPDIGRQMTEEQETLVGRCKEIANRLQSGYPDLSNLKQQAESINANHMAEQIQRMENSVETDPSLAIGTAKELIETCCKTILAERGKSLSGAPNIPELTKATLKELKLLPEDVPESARGAKTVKRLLSNLGTIGQCLAEMRGIYGTGHGKHGSAKGLSARHAKLMVGSAATLVRFLFETHEDRE